MRTIKLFVISLLIIFVGCSEDDSLDNDTLKVSLLEGKIEKGPFTQGSTVTIQELNGDLSLTGNSFQTDVMNNEGGFRLESDIEFASSYVQMACDGYFFNEVKGELSTGQVRLESIVDIADKRNINVNILTHLSKDRIINLVKEEGEPYENASLKVREELLTCFGLQEYKDLEFEDLSITSGESGSGVLITISSILLGERSEAELTEYISSLRETFTEAGTFPDSVMQSLRVQSYQLNTDDIATNIINRYSDLGKEISVPDLKYYIDWDRDGIAGNELGDPNIERQLSFETDTLHVSKDGGEFRVHINSNVPFIMHTNDNSGYIEPITLMKNISFLDTAISDDELILNIAPASEPFLRNATIRVSTFDRGLSANLTIIQEGDFSNEVSNSFTGGIILQAVDAFDNTHTIEAFYTNCYTTSSSQWGLFTSHELSAGNNNISNAWASLYRLNYHLNTLQKEAGNGSLKYIISLRSLLYYHLTTLWGDVPYVTPANMEDYYPSRTSASDIYASLKEQLTVTVDALPDDDHGSYFNVSKNVPKALLAKLFVRQGQYSEALALLQDIISSGSYTLNNSINDALASASTEMIYAVNKEIIPTPYHTEHIDENSYLPLIQYSEILLLAAECSDKIGNTEDAISYLNQIRDRNDNTPSTPSSFESDLKETWKNTLKGGFSYLDFLNRNGLTMNELNIQEYQMLLPIPSSEINLNPNVHQNPGY